MVGAAAADITPPLAGTLANDPPTATRAALRRAAHFALEEPYIDVNGNGQYDAGDPTDPSASVPTVPRLPDADATAARVRPTALERIYLDAQRPVTAYRPRSRSDLMRRCRRNGNEDDRDHVRTRKASSGDLGPRPQKVQSDGGFGLDEMFMSRPTTSRAGHDRHRRPELRGLGCRPFYVEFNDARAAQSIEQAAQNLRRRRSPSGRSIPTTHSVLVVVSVRRRRERRRHAGARPHDRRGDRDAGQLRHPCRDSASRATARIACTSSDWPHFARQALEQMFAGGGDDGGAVGSVEMPKVFTSPQSFMPSIPQHPGTRLPHDL